MTQKDFIKTYKPFALESERKTGISALFYPCSGRFGECMGKSPIGNNFFGIKVPKSLVSSIPKEKKQTAKNDRGIILS